MPERLHTVLGVTAEDLDAVGAFDGFFKFDSQFHIDPALLTICEVPEFESSHQRLEQHFENVLRLLNAAPAQSGPIWEAAIRNLTFREINIAALGYTAEGAGGKAMGLGIATELAKTAFEIVKAGIKDPVIFELVGLFQPKIGADLISDMTLRIILPDVEDYNQRVAESLKLQTTIVSLGDRSIVVPCHKDTDEALLLLPRNILSTLPVAYSWEDVDTVTAYNEDLRRRINSQIGNSWKEATSGKVSKATLRSILIKYPELLRDLIRKYKGKPLIPYDFEDDPCGELIWHKVAEDVATLYPLKLLQKESPDRKAMMEIVISICNHYRILIENNGLVKLLYDRSNVLKPEKAAQLLFYGIADAYCKANNLDLSPECDSGRGPVDFKLSTGYCSRITVEVKYTSNPKLVSGYKNQLKTYNKAEKAFASVYLVLTTKTTSSTMIQNLNSERTKFIKEVGSAPEIIFVDALPKPSASKL